MNRTMPNTPEWMASYGLDYSHPGYKFKARLSANRYGTVLTQDWSVVDYVTVFSAPYIERPAGTVVNLSIEKELVSFRDKSALSLRENSTTCLTAKMKYIGVTRAPDAAFTWHCAIASTKNLACALIQGADAG